MFDHLQDLPASGAARHQSADRDAIPAGAVDVDRPGTDMSPTLSDDQLEREICSHSAHLAAAECHLVLLVAEFDRRGTWAAGGLRSCAHWLNWRCGTALGAAREQVRVGRALDGLPLVKAAFGEGRLSYSKVRALTRIATPELEEDLLALALLMTASQLDELVRDYRRADPDERERALARHDRRFFRSHTDADGMVVIHARLSPEDGAVVLAAIEATREALAEDGRAGDEDGPDVPAETRRGSPDVPAETRAGVADVPAETRADAPGSAARPTADHGSSCPGPSEGPGDASEMNRADALVTLCASLLDQGLQTVREGPGAVVLVHVDEGVLADPASDGCCSIDGVGALAAHSARRLACDATVTRLLYRADGEVVPLGRAQSIPPRIRRAVLARDRGCRFPGCTRRRFVDVHHVVFWTDDGPTTPSNLLSMCRFHHRLVHEGGYRVELDDLGRIVASTPAGMPIPSSPAPVTPEGPPPAERHDREGLAIDESTLSWGGERYDRAMAVDGLLWRAGKLLVSS